MHFRKYSFGVAIVCLAMLASSLTARATDVTGIVRDSMTGSPLSNVTVFIVETGDRTVSDSNGALNFVLYLPITTNTITEESYYEFSILYDSSTACVHLMA